MKDIINKNQYKKLYQRKNINEMLDIFSLTDINKL